MIKILHSGDWHLDAPMGGDAFLRQALLQVPQKVAQVCKTEKCDLCLLSGDLFDGKASPESIHALKLALREIEVPTFISPGNHDFITPDSPYLTEVWPENVHIFTTSAIESIYLPDLDCRIYGAAFEGMDCPALLEGFHVQDDAAFHIGLFHGDPTVKNSPYNPISHSQVGASGLHYLALGHIHKEGSLRSKGTLCAWPGCPMGRGFDELEEKGVLVTTLADKAEARFLPLDTVRFYDLQAEVLTDGLSAVASILPALGSQNYYRLTLTGESEPVDLGAIRAAFPLFPHLELKDHTSPVTDLWGCIDQDSLEGMYFKMLHDALDGADDKKRASITLAAKISRKLLDGREVLLP